MSDRSEALRRAAHDTMRRLQHEVRTPISQIVGYSELLEEELEDRGADDLAPDLQRIRDAAQRLLDLVDGRLQDEQDPGAPVLPPAEAEGAATAEARQDAGEADAAPRLLVVDDDPSARELLARRFQRQGFRVDTARDGLEGLRRIEADPPDLVLLEILMPGMNGLEVLERMRRSHGRAELPVILATALDGSEDVVEGLSRGANDYVTKPLDFPVVLARVQTQLELHRTARQAAGLARQLEFRSAFIRQALGRDVSEDLLVEMAERPNTEDMSAQTRRVVAVVADVRGSRERAASLPPARHAAVLRNVLDGLGDLVAHYDGLLDAVNGDAVVALFGLPLPRADDAERAAACAVAFQLEMAELNARAAQVQLPEVTIGVGVCSGEVVVVGIGRDDHVKYKALGAPIVTATHIEAAADPGEVWICDATRAALGERARVDRSRELDSDGAGAVRVHRLLGVGGAHLISLRTPEAG